MVGGKKILCKYSDETDWKEYRPDYTRGVDIDDERERHDWVNYMIPVMPYKEDGLTFYCCQCYCSEKDNSYPTVKYGGRTYNMWKDLSAQAFKNKFHHDMLMMKEMSAVENAIEELD